MSAFSGLNLRGRRTPTAQSIHLLIGPTLQRVSDALQPVARK